jgi:hypothetical protein
VQKRVRLDKGRIPIQLAVVTAIPARLVHARVVAERRGRCGNGVGDHRRLPGDLDHIRIDVDDKQQEGIAALTFLRLVTYRRICGEETFNGSRCRVQEESTGVDDGGAADQLDELQGF